MVEFSLIEQPWIPVLTDNGMDHRSLTTVFAADVIDLASGDTLEDAAILRLLVAIKIAAAADRLSPQRWLNVHADRFDLFSPLQPFGQNIDMARFVNLDRSTRPLSAQSYVLAGNGSTAVNQFHTLSGVTFTPAAAARLLLMRQAFSVGGIQQWPAAAYGKEPCSAKSAVCTNRAFMWVDTGRLASTVDVNAQLAGGRPLGTFHFGWPDPGAYPPVQGRPTGVLDALTWPSRSIYLLPADPVQEVMICDGLRWPEPKEGTDYTPQHEAELFPHAVFERKTKSAPPTIQGVHVERVPWRQLLTALAVGQPESTIMTTAAGAGLPDAAVFRIAGLGSYQARVDGPVAGSFPVPAPGVDVVAVSELINEAFVNHGSYFGSLATAAGLTDRKQSASLVGRLSQYSALPAQLEPIAAAAARGLYPLEEARRRVAAVVERANGSALRQFAPTHVVAAGRVAARKASTLPPHPVVAAKKPRKDS
ncbi:type I-E CRISPR-associated protein Cse1/CasA [Mycolicibacterium senegalense]|uniref:type I-E CRISPR-associated protein Cse1/CasA n=1 Tax=Mycolicibacterium senegalense TaxID=1796 RepID=UPI003AAA8703